MFNRYLQGDKWDLRQTFGDGSTNIVSGEVTALHASAYSVHMWSDSK